MLRILGDRGDAVNIRGEVQREESNRRSQRPRFPTGRQDAHVLRRQQIVDSLLQVDAIEAPTRLRLAQPRVRERHEHNLIARSSVVRLADWAAQVAR
jgi:hypothetical protein